MDYCELELLVGKWRQHMCVWPPFNKKQIYSKTF